MQCFLTHRVFDLDEEDPNIHIFQVADHNHPDETDLIASSSNKQRMVKAIEADPSKPVKMVYDEVICDAEDDDQVPQFNSVLSRLHRSQDMRPSCPRSHKM